MFGGMMQKAKLYSQCNHVPIIFLKRKSVHVHHTHNYVRINGIM